MPRMLDRVKFDARPDRLDLRDLPYRPPLVSLPSRWPADGDVERFLPAYRGLVLDQGSEGACTGYGLAAVVNYLRFVRNEATAAGLEPVSPKLLFDLARLYDEWPGEDYEYSSCRGALKGWHKHGVCPADLWPYDAKRHGDFPQWRDRWRRAAARVTLGVYYRINASSVVDMQAAIHQIGAIFVSSLVHQGWDTVKPGRPTHEGLGVITRPKRLKTEGHAFALVGYDERGFVVQNSWGADWGTHGFAILPYDDWVKHGQDAWAAALGVPAAVDSPEIVVRGAVRPGLAAAGSAAAFRVGAAGASLPRWTADEALDHTIVSGNDGFVLRRKVDLGDAAATVDFLARQHPRDSGCRKLVLYLHGGLNSESASLERVRALGPVFRANGIHPLFLSWRSGTLETIDAMLADLAGQQQPPAGLPEWMAKIKDRAADVWDRTIELAAANAGVKAMWREMKENASLGASPGRGLHLLAHSLAALVAEKKTEVHCIAHSAGAIVFAGLLPLLNKKLTVKTCTLWAPAATIDLALSRYVPALDHGTLAHLTIENLSDLREREDTVGGVYRKSLLYLVCRALEDRHRTPLMGLAAAYDEASARDRFEDPLTAWRTAIARTKIHHVIRHDAAVSNGVERRRIAHGTFDNDVKSVKDAIERILGGPLVSPVGKLDY